MKKTKTKVRARPLSKPKRAPRRDWFKPCDHLARIRLDLRRLEYAVAAQDIPKIRLIARFMKEFLADFRTIHPRELL